MIMPKTALLKGMAARGWSPKNLSPEQLYTLASWLGVGYSTLAGNMAVAYFYAHAPRGFFPQLNGGKLAILYCFVFLYLFVAGAGEWSVDQQRASSRSR